MSVFIYSSGGLVAERPESEHKQIGHEIHAYNLENPGSPRKLFIGPSFPPAGHVFDGTQGELRLKTLSEKLADGELTLPDNYTIESGPKGEQMVSSFHKLDANGDVVAKTMQEKVDDGLVEFDAQTHKIENNQIVPKTNQDMLDDATMTLSDLKDRSIRRLRSEVLVYFETKKTANGYRLDLLSRQKAALSQQYRATDNSDPVKADLLTKKLIYTDAITDEILAAVEQVQVAYNSAKEAVQTAFDNNNPAGAFEAIQLSDYIT